MQYYLQKRVNLCTCSNWLKDLLHLNMAACLLKIGEYRKSVESCNKVIPKPYGEYFPDLDSY